MLRHWRASEAGRDAEKLLRVHRRGVWLSDVIMDIIERPWGGKRRRDMKNHWTRRQVSCAYKSFTQLRKCGLQVGGDQKLLKDKCDRSTSGL